MPLTGKKILVGITGGIAAYKVCELVRQLIKMNAEIKAVLTPSAKEFVTETTLRTLTRNPVYCEQFHVENWQPEHVSLADNADLFIIAPVSANTIGKIANGICDNLLTSLVMAYKKPVILAPAMNCNMWENPFMQENLSKLEAANFCIIPPESGDLACGYQGVGRMAEVEKIVEKVLEIVNQNRFLKGKKIVITAGGTKEAIDPVRYIGNHSSGKMGIALADAAYRFGAKISLVSSVQVNRPYKVLLAESALEMLNTVKNEFADADSLIMAAAVADYRPKVEAQHKIKKGDNETLTIELIKNPDILKEISAIKKNSQTVIGFCAESQDLIQNAKGKIESKNLDFIVANDISNKEIGFNSDYNAVSIIDKSGKIMSIEKRPKNEVAEIILRKVFNG